MCLDKTANLLLWKRAQQKAANVPMRTVRARKAPTATPIITANRRVSERENNKSFQKVSRKSSAISYFDIFPGYIHTHPRTLTHIQAITLVIDP
jgi:hypothetical protein